LEDAGGLVGNNHEGSVINSYSCGVVYSDVNAGGLVGSGGGTVNNCFWDMETSNQATSAGGTGKTTAEMQDVATYTSLATVGLDTPWDLLEILSMILVMKIIGILMKPQIMVIHF